MLVELKVWGWGGITVYDFEELWSWFDELRWGQKWCGCQDVWKYRGMVGGAWGGVAQSDSKPSLEM